MPGRTPAECAQERQRNAERLRFAHHVAHVFAHEVDAKVARRVLARERGRHLSAAGPKIPALMLESANRWINRAGSMCTDAPG